MRGVDFVLYRKMRKLPFSPRSGKSALTCHVQPAVLRVTRHTKAGFLTLAKSQWDLPDNASQAAKGLQLPAPWLPLRVPLGEIGVTRWLKSSRGGARGHMYSYIRRRRGARAVRLHWSAASVGGMISVSLYGVGRHIRPLSLWHNCYMASMGRVLDCCWGRWQPLGKGSKGGLPTGPEWSSLGAVRASPV